MARDAQRCRQVVALAEQGLNQGVDRTRIRRARRQQREGLGPAPAHALHEAAVVRGGSGRLDRLGCVRHRWLQNAVLDWPAAVLEDKAVDVASAFARPTRLH